MTSPAAIVRLEGQGSSISVATAFGPRIVALEVDGRNLFAELPDATLPGPDGSTYRLRGGHRLWAGPEVPDVTYRTDDEPCTVTAIGDGVRIEAPADGAALAKSITVVPAVDGWVLEHAIEHRGGSPLGVAPWAITQLRPGGRCTLPFAAAGEGLQADRSLVLWPYTDPTDERIDVSAGEVRVEAPPAGPALKLGVAGSAGRVRYELDGVAFEKAVDVEPTTAYADLGAAVQVYVCDRFVELETLGPITPLVPGGSVTHRETWTVG